MDAEEQEEVEQAVRDALRSEGIEADGTVQETVLLSHHVWEVIAVYLPHAASALGGAGLKAVSELIVAHFKRRAETKGTSTKLTIYGPDGKPFKRIDVVDKDQV
jgi:hypothetical protein